MLKEEEEEVTSEVRGLKVEREYRKGRRTQVSDGRDCILCVSATTKRRMNETSTMR